MTKTTAPSGKGYIYGRRTTHARERFQANTALAAPAVAAGGGSYAVRGVKPDVLEGRFDAHRVVLVEFASPEAARSFYHSAAYQAAKAKRTGVADFKMLLLPGSVQQPR